MREQRLNKIKARCIGISIRLSSLVFPRSHSGEKVAVGSFLHSPVNQPLVSLAPPGDGSHLARLSSPTLPWRIGRKDRISPSPAAARDWCEARSNRDAVSVPASNLACTRREARFKSRLEFCLICVCVCMCDVYVCVWVWSVSLWWLMDFSLNPIKTDWFSSAFPRSVEAFWDGKQEHFRNPLQSSTKPKAYLSIYQVYATWLPINHS